MREIRACTTVAPGSEEVSTIQVVHERCGSLDVHKKTVTVCTITPEGKETRSYGTMTQRLAAIVEWLEAKGVTCVAIESTGYIGSRSTTYWRRQAFKC